VEPADPEDLEDPGVPGDSDRPDDGERTGLAGGDTDGPGADPDAADPDAADPDAADPDAADPDAADPDAADPDAADALGWVGEVVASWVQAAMITRSLAGSALPPTPLRSTK
jgi:hypothetical protein